MSITQTMTSSFKEELLLAEHDFEADTFKMALYLSSANLGPSTTVYTATGETSGSGYTAGGKAMTGVVVNLTGTVAWVDFDDVMWTTSSSLTARGALIYNSSNGNKSVAVIDFGSDKTSLNDFTVQMPTPDASNALIRIV